MMKRLTLFLTCILMVALFSQAKRLTGNSLRGDLTDTKVVENTTQDPVPIVEWDPERQGIGDLTEGPRIETAPQNRKPLKVIGQRFTPTEFAAYVKRNVVPELNKRGHWKPSFIVLHHTGVPSISQRREGFTNANIASLARYYGVGQGWRSGPHLFVDQNGIWVFTPLTRTGTHSPSWNGVAWGIEQLGNFSIEDYDSGQGEKIRDNAIAAVAILSVARNLNINTLHFHLEDRRTSHKNCPGTSCKKTDVVSKATSEIVKWRGLWNSL